MTAGQSSTTPAARSPRPDDVPRSFPASIAAADHAEAQPSREKESARRAKPATVAARAYPPHFAAAARFHAPEPRATVANRLLHSPAALPTRRPPNRPMTAVLSPGVGDSCRLKGRQLMTPLQDCWVRFSDAHGPKQRDCGHGRERRQRCVSSARTPRRRAMHACDRRQALARHDRRPVQLGNDRSTVGQLEAGDDPDRVRTTGRRRLARRGRRPRPW
jgi:hypothetical protein